MKMSTEIIKNLNPCSNRFENYLKHYKDFEGDLDSFLALDKISFMDKVWVFTKLATKEQNVSFALKCAKSVLSIFEIGYPNDLRPRTAIKAIEKWLLNTTKENFAVKELSDNIYRFTDAAKAAYAAASYVSDVTHTSAIYAADAADRNVQNIFNFMKESIK